MAAAAAAASAAHLNHSSAAVLHQPERAAEMMEVNETQSEIAGGCDGDGGWRVIDDDLLLAGGRDDCATDDDDGHHHDHSNPFQNDRLALWQQKRDSSPTQRANHHHDASQASTPESSNQMQGYNYKNLPQKSLSPEPRFNDTESDLSPPASPEIIQVLLFTTYIYSFIKSDTDQKRL